jgi:hypothetical protein
MSATKDKVGRPAIHGLLGCESPVRLVFPNVRRPPSKLSSTKRPGASAHRRASAVLRRGETEMEYDNTNKGALFKNDDKDPNDDKDRDYFGSLDIEGTEYWLSGWVRTSKKSGKKYLSLSVKPKQQAAREQQVARV